MLFEKIPYTNFHDLNTDWIIKKINEVIDQCNELETEVENLTARVEALEGGEPT